MAASFYALGAEAITLMIFWDAFSFVFFASYLSTRKTS